MYNNNRHESKSNRVNDPGGFSAPATNYDNHHEGGNQNDNGDDDDEELVEPKFRSVAVKPHLAFALAQSNVTGEGGGGMSLYDPNQKPFGMNLRSINNSSSFYKSNNNQKATTNQAQADIRQAAAVVSDAELRQWKAQAAEKIYVLPMYYPMCSRRSATCQESVETLLDRLHCCFKKLNIQARFEQDFPTFGLVLRTVEQLELSLLVWYADKSRETVYVELDKRQCGNGCSGSSGTFPFQYICRILKCVSCPCTKQDMQNDTLGLAMPKHLAMMQGNCYGQAEQVGKLEDLMGTFQKQEKTVTSSSFETPMEETEMEYSCVEQQALSSLQMIWMLLQSPVTWCKGLELLCDVSDLNKTGLSSAQVVSRVILLGTSSSSTVVASNDCCRGIHENLASMLKALSGDARADAVEQVSCYQKDCLLQMVLTCFVNAMEVQVKYPEEGTTSSASSILNQFLSTTRGTSSCDILTTLINIMRHANTKPHHAYLAVKALFLLSSDVSIRNTVSVAMMVQNGSTAVNGSASAASATGNAAERCAVLQQAQQVGTQSHGLLEAECERLQRVLEMRP